MANNDEIFNAVLSGAGGASQERWITSTVAGSYDEFVTKVVEIATEVDSLIAPASIDIGERSLMQAIAQGVFSGRFPQVNDYTQIAGAIVQLYDALAAQLYPEGGGGGGGSVSFTTSNKNMAALLTDQDGDLACNTAVANTPAPSNVLSGAFQVLVNGVSVILGDGTKVGVAAYFSGDGGVTARNQRAIVAGDLLYWNPSVATYDLATTDLIDFNYLIAV